jgi:hypothetical protein
MLSWQGSGSEFVRGWAIMCVYSLGSGLASLAHSCRSLSCRPLPPLWHFPVLPLQVAPPHSEPQSGLTVIAVEPNMPTLAHLIMLRDEFFNGSLPALQW